MGEQNFIHIVCSVLFFLFTFSYLFFFQSDVMAVTQHLASGGQTFYNPLLGAILITIVLKLLQIGVSSLIRLTKRGYALTYFPSFLFLTIISDLKPASQGVSLGNWIWISPILFVIYFFVIISVKRYEPYELESRSIGPFSQQVWSSLLIMLGLFLFTGLFSNTDKHFHQRAKVESMIDKRNYVGALHVIKTVSNTDSVMSMLTIYAVARCHQLSDSLFCYPLIGGSDVLRPGKIHSWLQPDSILQKSTRNSANYQLVGFLLDRNLHDFARYLVKYYPIDTIRPRYYREAYQIYLLHKKGLKPKGPYAAGSYAAYYFRQYAK